MVSNIIGVVVNIMSVIMYKNWKKKTKQSNGKLPKHSPNFDTIASYEFTDITYKKVVDKSGVVVAVEVKATKRDAKLKIGVDSREKLYHFDGFDANGKVIKPETTITTFTKQQLQNNAKMTEAFWGSLSLKKCKKCILNDKSSLFKANVNDEDLSAQVIIDSSNENLGDKNDPPDGCGTKSSVLKKRRATSSGKSCSINLKPTGEVESIHSEQFVEDYKKATDTQKQQLAALAEGNLDKVTNSLGSDSEKNRVKNLVALESMKTHSGSAIAASDVEDIRKKPNSLQAAGEFESLKGKLSQLGSKVKLSTSKMSAKISTLTGSKGLHGISNGIGTVSDTMGVYFTAKTIINGIQTGDTTALAIVGAQVGYEVATTSAIKFGQKYFKEASKLGKITKGIGKIAGPIGALGDIGLTAWSISKSVGRLKSNNKYERNDAILDIVSDSLDIALTIVSVVFPELAPLIAIFSLFKGFFFGALKAQNEVNRINAEIPLSESEKAYVYNSRKNDWFGSRPKDYLEYLLEEKEANNLIVQQQLQFLNENPSVYGIVFPSRTLQYDGACRLTKRYCNYESPGVCWNWDNEVTLGTGCDWNKPCGGRICTNERKPLNNGFNEYKCICEGNPTENYGEPRKNSYVDFRSKQTLYWERAVPKDVEGANFKCKPGSTHFEDYKIHQEQSRTDFLCENAIALLQPPEKLKDATTMVFNLEEGDDTVYAANDPPLNLFVLPESGTKQFYGGATKNDFLFDGKCTGNLKGTLTGGTSGGNSITFGENCAKGQNVRLDMVAANLRSSNGNFEMAIYNVEVVSGRVAEADYVNAGCQTKRLSLGGGTMKEFDVVALPELGCNYNLSIIAADYTHIYSNARTGSILLAFDESWKGVTASFDVFPRSLLGINVFFLGTTSKDVIVGNVTAANKKLLTTISSNANGDESLSLELNFQKNDPEIDQSFMVYFNESGDVTPHSILVLSNVSSFFHHTLPEVPEFRSNNLYRTGCSNTANVFEITGSGWCATGGNLDDEFILIVPDFTEVNGNGGEDSLWLHQNLTTDAPMHINLAENKKFKSIEKIHDSTGKIFTVTSACGTKLVNSLGGSKTIPDVIMVPPGSCDERELQILTKGHSHVEVSTQMGNISKDSILVMASALTENETSALQFSLNVSLGSVDGLQILLQLTHKNWKSFHSNKTDEHSALVTLNGMPDEFIKIMFTNVSANPDEAYLLIPSIQVALTDSTEPPGLLLIEQESQVPKILYQLSTTHLENNGSNILKGFEGIAHIFQIINGTWDITGGNSSDVFICQTGAPTRKMNIDGGNSGENTFILEHNSDFQSAETYGVNLKTGEFGYLWVQAKGKISNIHHVVGSIERPDFIHAACNTKSINGRSGKHKGQEDIIFINGKNCSKDEKAQTTTVVGKFTKVKNTAEEGIFTYMMPDFVTSELDLKTSAENLHQIKFGFSPWELIRNVTFDEKTEILSLVVGIGRPERLQKFNMKKQNETEDYTNPIFEFQKPGIPAVSDIQVGKDGITIATIMIQGALSNLEQYWGLPVHMNRFFVNITTNNKITFGGVLYGNALSYANQFWISELTSGLSLLDGGSCSIGADKKCTNYLHLHEDFEPNCTIEVNVGRKDGFMKSENKVLISQLINIHEITARSRIGAVDIVAVSDCGIQSLSEFEEISIIPEEGNDCVFELTMEIGNETTVWFEELEINFSNDTDDIAWLNSTFTYVFTSPRSFNLNGSSETAWLGVSHKYYLPFTIDDLQNIRFDLENDTLYYSVGESEHSLEMITRPSSVEQFYSQPILVTKDSFRVQVARDGSFFFSLAAGSSFPNDTLEPTVVPIFQERAKSLGISIMLQTETQFLYFGHEKMEGDRNVIQNVGYSESHMAGGGADDTIYEIVSLDKDVFIYPGFDNVTLQPATNATKQTIDLTDIVVPIRTNSSTKFVPRVLSHGNNLEIIMNGFEKKYPGKVVIVGGSINSTASRIQLLLNNAIMDFSPIPGNENKQSSRVRRSSSQQLTSEWAIKPRPVLVSASTAIYSLSKEDLEDDHEIRVEATTNNSFTAARNGSDLYLTNLMYTPQDPNGKDAELTTIVIIDFFTKSDSENSLVDDEEEDAPMHVLPNVVRNIKVSLPGLSLLLNDSIVYSGNYDEDNETTKQPLPVMPWGVLLQMKEEYILRDMPDIPRQFVYERDEPIPGSYYWPYLALSLFITLTVIACIVFALYFKLGKRTQDVLFKVQEIQTVKPPGYVSTEGTYHN